ncbi:ATP/GTP-binding protein [Homoserinibacter sp. GY 40078]|uniref:GTP-binding protein n=1 Tax=Homoserinibacter sp. GY 40078 TaxID=2603275 RepID=UPI0011CC7722|nr:ATP/GTP-binding protein [Homoserinibacter sp. GY 40078]TXK19661.1 ATP-binding protein [Homoserinibacter sp. GY 40078]
MPEHVILFAGPMGAGKSTAIRALSDIEVISTEATNTDRAGADKDTTTVGLDYGEIDLGPDEKVRLYGVPGQSRFDFMWSILQERAMGLVVLVSATMPEPERLVHEHLSAFAPVARRGGVVIGVTHVEPGMTDLGDRIVQAAHAVIPERPTPVFALDARDPQQMRTLLLSLVADIETRIAMAVPS